MTTSYVTEWCGHFYNPYSDYSQAESLKAVMQIHFSPGREGPVCDDRRTTR
jgi:hypothetical protein